MKELVEFLAASLVDHPTFVKVEEKGTAADTALYLTVKREDLGKIIGKKGRTIKAIRSIVIAAAAKQKTKISLEISEPAEESAPALGTPQAS